MPKILMIEDDVHIGDMVSESLLKAGFEPLRAYSGTEALLVLERSRPDLILLDLMLPGLSGEEILPEIRDIPVIVLSAKAGIDDKVEMLLGGAVDYMTKPFEIKELLARIAAHLRKAAGNDAPQILTAGHLSMNLPAHEVRLSGQSIRLTKTEYAILKLLMKNKGQALSKSTILERISEDTPDCTDASLKQHVSNLRKKLRGVDGNDPIEAVWGIGFRLNL